MEMAAAAFLQERIWRKVYQFKYTLQTIEVLDPRGFFSFFFFPLSKSSIYTIFQLFSRSRKTHIIDNTILCFGIQTPAGESTK